MNPPRKYDGVALDVEARAVLSSATLLWRSLTQGEQAVLLAANEHGWLVSGRKRDRDRLRERGLARGLGTGLRLTGLGAVVREVGFANN